jgi:hypothetical protein
VTADEIRALNYTPPREQWNGMDEDEARMYIATYRDEREFMVRREIAAQLAELNANGRMPPDIFMRRKFPGNPWTLKLAPTPEPPPSSIFIGEQEYIPR